MKLILTLLLFISSIYAQNTKEIFIVTESWKGATNRDGTGLYWDIMQAVYAPLGYKIIKKHLSYNAAAEMVQNNTADIYLGAYFNEKKFAQYPKYYFDQDVIVAIYNKISIENWEGQESLKGLKVAWMRGYDFDKFLSVKVKSKELNSRDSGLKLLKSEHIDAFIDDKDDISTYLKRAHFNKDDFAVKRIMQLKLYPGFAKNPKGKKLMKIWDERMKVLIKDEAFKKLYFHSEYALFPY